LCVALLNCIIESEVLNTAKELGISIKQLGTHEDERTVLSKLYP